MKMQANYNTLPILGRFPGNSWVGSFFYQKSKQIFFSLIKINLWLFSIGIALFSLLQNDYSDNHQHCFEKFHQYRRFIWIQVENLTKTHKFLQIFVEQRTENSGFFGSSSFHFYLVKDYSIVKNLWIDGRRSLIWEIRLGD